jgi:hypothetical protein
MRRPVRPERRASGVRHRPAGHVQIGDGDRAGLRFRDEELFAINAAIGAIRRIEALGRVDAIERLALGAEDPDGAEPDGQAARLPSTSIAIPSGPPPPPDIWMKTPTLLARPSFMSGTRHTALSRVTARKMMVSSALRTRLFGLGTLSRMQSSWTPRLTACSG